MTRNRADVRQVSISKLCTGETESVTWDLPGKGPVAQVHATFTFRPTEALNDAALDIERDSFGFEIPQLQRETYLAHRDALQRIGKDDRQRIEELLETGLLVERQQVRCAALVRLTALLFNAAPLLMHKSRNGSVR
jgi:hypothetical protein